MNTIAFHRQVLCTCISVWGSDISPCATYRGAHHTAIGTCCSYPMFIIFLHSSKQWWYPCTLAADIL